MSQDNYEIQYEEAVLPGYSEFRHLSSLQGGAYTMEDFGYRDGCRDQFKTFARRLRVAKSMISVEFDGFGEVTAFGYQELMRHFMMFTAVERYFQDCEGIKGSRYENGFSYLHKDWFAQIHEAFFMVDEQTYLFDFLLKNMTNDHHRTTLEKWARGNPNHKAGLYISVALRNCFVHGTLTATPYGTKENDVAHLCEYMSKFLYGSIIEDFQERLRRLKVH